jgi:mono/diheme cytochrome c family protein
LTAEESTAVAAYVRSNSTGKLAEWNVTAEGSVSRGRELFASRGCNRCHTHERSELAAAPYETLFGDVKLRGCLAADGKLSGGAPRFGFSEEQRDALVQFLRTNDRSLRCRVEDETTARLMKWLRCGACHDRDEVYSLLPDILADEGELGYDYDRLPNLGRAGEKLNSDWLQRLFAGELDYRSRPWLRMRMPAFPAYASLLAGGLAAEHGITDTQPPDKINADLAHVGQLLATKTQGFDCLQCHAIDDKFLVLENKANGVGLSYSTDRLRKEYYHRWIRDPLRIDPLTKMPKFSDDGVRSLRTEYFDGDAKMQFEALWHYMVQLEAEREKR